MKFLLISVLAVSALHAARIPSYDFPGDTQLVDVPLEERMEKPMDLKKEEGLEGACKSPQVFEGKFVEEGVGMNSKKYVEAFSFDGEGKRIRILSSVMKGWHEILTYTLILAEENVMYSLDIYTGICINMTYDKPWVPAGLPLDANYYGTTRLAGLSVENEGLLVDFYNGETPEGKYFAGVTRYGCWPTTVVFNSTSTGPTTTTYLDLTAGIMDTDVFIIPIQCRFLV